MGRKKYSEKEKRTLVLTWLDIASGLKLGDTFYIPMKHNVERTYYLKESKRILQEFRDVYETSIYHNIYPYSISKNKIMYLAFTKKTDLPKVGFITSQLKKDKALKILVNSKYTRKMQIKLLLEEGVSPKEIIDALGDTLNREEINLLKGK